ncbi:hypothetical protein [Streptomyces prunicolor]|uniref:hypothetical protein n=1 Tax=Streptomyces prunicolor TaxID=67348 RepID=UPI00342946EC
MAEIRTELGQGEEAVLSALGAFLRAVALRSPFRGKSLALLLRQRESLGEAAFCRILEIHRTPEEAASIAEFLDTFREALDARPEPS